MVFFSAKLRAVKLQSYWKKICDDERRSKQRNAQLLRDLDRMENNMASLEARREKLRQLKVMVFELESCMDHPANSKDSGFCMQIKSFVTHCKDSTKSRNYLMHNARKLPICYGKCPKISNTLFHTFFWA